MTTNGTCETLCSDDYKQFLVWELSIEDKEHERTLQDSLEYLWEMSNIYSFGNLEIQYLYSKLELIKVLMGCSYNDHDFTQGRTHQLDQSESKRQENTHGGSQASNHSYSQSDSCAISEYNDRAKGFMKAYAKRLSHSTTTDKAASRGDDTSFGAGRVDGCSDEFSEGSSENSNSSTSGGVGRGDSRKKGRQYEFSQSTSSGKGKVPFITEWTLTAGGSSWDRDSYNESSSNDAEKRQGRSFRKSVSASLSDRRSKRTSCSYFQTATMSCSTGTSDMVSCDVSSSTRDAEAEASGEGFSKATYDMRSVAGSQGNAENHSDHEFKSVGEGYKSNKLDVIKNSQKFKHLLELYDMTRNYLEKLKDIARGQLGYNTTQSILPCELSNCLYTFVNTLYCRRCGCYTNKCSCNNGKYRCSSASFSYGGH